MNKESGRGREREREIHIDPCVGEQVLGRVPETLIHSVQHNNRAKDPTRRRTEHHGQTRGAGTICGEKLVGLLKRRKLHFPTPPDNCFFFYFLYTLSRSVAELLTAI